jgi:hypothetical protein
LKLLSVISKPFRLAELESALKEAYRLQRERHDPQT